MANMAGMAGPERLKAYTQRVGISLTDVAKILGVGEQTVHQWSSGMSRPRAVMKYALHALADIEPEAWLTKEERDDIVHIKAEISSLRDASPVKPRTFKDQMAGRI